MEAGSKETLALPIVPPVITSPPLKEEAAVGKVKVKKLQKRKGVRVMTTKGELRAAGMSAAQAKSTQWSRWPNEIFLLQLQL